MELIRQIRELTSRFEFWSCLAYDEQMFGERALGVGAAGYLNKQSSTQKIVEAIYCVLSGKIFSMTVCQSDIRDTRAVIQNAAALEFFN